MSAEPRLEVALLDAATRLALGDLRAALAAAAGAGVDLHAEREWEPGTAPMSLALLGGVPLVPEGGAAGVVALLLIGVVARQRPADMVPQLRRLRAMARLMAAAAAWGRRRHALLARGGSSGGVAGGGAAAATEAVAAAGGCDGAPASVAATVP